MKLWDQSNQKPVYGKEVRTELGLALGLPKYDSHEHGIYSYDRAIVHRMLRLAEHTLGRGVLNPHDALVCGQIRTALYLMGERPSG